MRQKSKEISFKALWNKLNDWRQRKSTNVMFDYKEWCVSGFGETWIHGHKFIIGTRFEPSLEGFHRVDRRIYEYEWQK
jgi:hypothetical protein